MRFIDRVKTAVAVYHATKGWDSTAPFTDPHEIGWNLFTRYSTMPRRAVGQWMRTYGTHVRLRTPVHRIATDIASVHWSVFRVDPDDRSKRVDVTHEHPMGALLRCPNPWFSGSTLRHLWQVYWDVGGEWFTVLKKLPGESAPIEMWPVPPHWVMSVPNEEQPFYRVSFRGRFVEIPPEFMIWSQEPDPTDPYNRGLGTAYCIEDEIQQDEYASKYNSAFFRNGGSPGLIIGVPGLTDPKQAKRLEDKWSDEHGGFWNAFKPAFINGDLKAVEIARAHKDMEFTEMRKFLRDTIYQTYGIPPEVLGIIENSNRATADAAMYIYGILVLTPRLNKMRESLNRYLVPLYDDPLLEVDYESPVKETQDFKLQKASEGLTRGAITVNEWRAINGWPPIEGGDVRLVPQNTAPNGLLAPQPNGKWVFMP